MSVLDVNSVHQFNHLSPSSAAFISTQLDFGDLWKIGETLCAGAWRGVYPSYPTTGLGERHKLPKDALNKQLMIVVYAGCYTWSRDTL